MAASGEEGIVNHFRSSKTIAGAGIGPRSDVQWAITV
jgi:hypothetical protein